MFEIKNTSNKDIKRLIIDLDTDGINTSGFKVSNKDLYELYIELNHLFKDSNTKEIKKD